MMLRQLLLSQGRFPLVLADGELAPSLIVVLCIIAGLGMLYLLPSNKPAATRRVGGAALTAALLVLFVLAIHAVGGVGGPALGLYFWFFAIVAVVGAIRVVTHPQPVYSALYFVLTVFASGGLFVLLAADFLAAALILIYAGAILITYVFVIMLAAQATSGPAKPGEVGALGGLAGYDVTSREPFIATCVGFTLLGVMTFLIFDKAEAVIQPQPLADSVVGQVVPASFEQGPTQALGVYLFRHQLVNLELAGLILTLAMIGAIIIARRRVVSSGAEYPEDAGEEILGPATPVNDNPHSIPVLGTREPSQKAYPQT
jgi:NADH-quinone oxidoreductase subunit J